MVLERYSCLLVSRQICGACLADISAVVEAIMLVARPLCFAQELTNVQLAVDFQGHAPCMHTHVHTNTHCIHIRMYIYICQGQNLLLPCV